MVDEKRRLVGKLHTTIDQWKRDVIESRRRKTQEADKDLERAKRTDDRAGSTSDGSTGDGSTSDGSTSDGSTSDGSTSDGSTSDGSTSDGSERG